MAETLNREHHKLTVAMVAAASKPGRISDGGGLYLQTSSSGGKSWLFRYVYQGKENWMGFGSVDVGAVAESLAAARGKAGAARKAIANGKDPLAERRATEAAAKPITVPTFKQLAQEHIAQHSKDWKNPVHRKQWPDTLERYVYPTIGHLPVSSVDVHHIVEILSPIWHEKSETARRVRQRIEAVLDRAEALKYRPLGSNPTGTRLMHRVLGLGKPRGEHPFDELPHPQCPGFWANIVGRNDKPSLCMQWMILTAVRPSEARLARWDQLDVGARVWETSVKRNIRSQRNIPHRVPVTEPMLGILKKLKRVDGCPYLFPGQHVEKRLAAVDGAEAKVISDTSMRDLLRDNGLTADMADLHGFRKSFRNWARDVDKAPDDTAEKALAHIDKNVTQATYKTTDLLQERRGLMKRWGDYLVSDPFDFG